MQTVGATEGHKFGEHGLHVSTEWQARELQWLDNAVRENCVMLFALHVFIFHIQSPEEDKILFSKIVRGSCNIIAFWTMTEDDRT